jgi:plastocyanin
MKGLLGVGVAVAAPPTPAPVAPAAATSAAGASPAAAAASTACATPVSTTVSVNEYDFGFKLSRLSVPCGKVTFNMTNTGAAAHDFVIAGNSGAVIRTGQSTTMTADLGPGRFRYVCDVNGHQALGMVGTLTVTG